MLGLTNMDWKVGDVFPLPFQLLLGRGEDAPEADHE